ncbi:Uncharacterized protein HZ326_30178 [Fusarium oxysporum f. sp. albedinis]|nr:Uncharacterized protein HZ326_30178 [Fusarium oxysporum f. sp. albedinis]
MTEERLAFPTARNLILARGLVLTLFTNVLEALYGGVTNGPKPHLDSSLNPFFCDSSLPSTSSQWEMTQCSLVVSQWHHELFSWCRVWRQFREARLAVVTFSSTLLWSLLMDHIV